jgi:xylulokinase
VLEGVAFAFADGQAALSEAGTAIEDVSVIGGGARSALWGRILASALGRQLRYHHGSDVGPAFGAARLARLAESGEDPNQVCSPPPVERVVEPDAILRERYRQRQRLYRDLYSALRPHWFHDERM